MPEGPEVEHVRRALLLLEKKRLKKVTLTPLALKYQRYQEQKGKIDSINGKVLERLERRGKFLIWWFENFPVLNHLGMTGGWAIQKSSTASSASSDQMPAKYAKVVLDFESGIRAIFDDMRNFGRFQVYSSESDLLEQSPSVKALGINGLQEKFPQKQFEQLLSLPRNQNKALGEILLDSRLVTEIGNIYKSESLFLAKLNPYTKVKQLSSQEKKGLGQSIHQVLKRAFADELKWCVYGRAGESCLVCKNSRIERMVQKGRSTFYCPQCQAPIQHG